MTDLLYYARAVHYAASVVVAGIVFFSVFVSGPAFSKSFSDAKVAVGLWRRLSLIAWISLTLCLLSGAAWFILTAASMSGEPLADLYSQGVLWTVLWRTHFGNDWLVRFVIAWVLAGLLPGVLSASRSKSFWLNSAAVTLAAALTGSLAWAGHAIGAEGVEGVVHPAADVLHLIAAAAWVGGLVPLALLLSMTEADPQALTAARTATTRFSTLGIIAVATLLITGLVNGWYLVGSLPALTESEYGRLLLIKLALFLAMVGIAAFNWSWLTPRLVQDADLAAARKARRQLRRNAGIEATLGAVIIGIVAVLGTLPPASHANHESTSGPIPADASFQHIHGVDGMADVLVEPGHVGTANVTIHLWNDDLEPLAARELTLALTAPTPGSKPVTRTAARDNDGVWHVDGVRLPVAGNWTVTVAASLLSTERLELTAPIEIDPQK